MTAFQSFSDNGGESPDLVGAFERYCLEPDGDHELTWALAARDGYIAISPADFSNLRLPGANDVRGYTRTIAGDETRILTASNSEFGPGGRAYFHRCYVSASRYDLRRADRAIRATLGVPHFRFDKTWLYAWIPQPDGSNAPVSRNDFTRFYQRLAVEDGLRYATSRSYGEAVFVGYATPRPKETYKLPQ